jgi:hypothetical protein
MHSPREVPQIQSEKQSDTLYHFPLLSEDCGWYLKFHEKVEFATGYAIAKLTWMLGKELF